MFVCTFGKIQEIIKKKTEVSSHPSIPVCHLSMSPASVWVIGVCVCVCVYNARLNRSFIHKSVSCFSPSVHINA